MEYAEYLVAIGSIAAVLQAICIPYTIKLRIYVGRVATRFLFGSNILGIVAFLLIPFRIYELLTTGQLLTLQLTFLLFVVPIGYSILFFQFERSLLFMFQRHLQNQKG